MVLECLFILNSDWVWLGLFELDFEGTIQDKGGEKWRRGVGVGIDRSYCKYLVTLGIKRPSEGDEERDRDS